MELGLSIEHEYGKYFDQCMLGILTPQQKIYFPEEYAQKLKYHSLL